MRATYPCARCRELHERQGLIPVDGGFKVCLGCDQVMRADHAEATEYVARCTFGTAA